MTQIRPADATYDRRMFLRLIVKPGDVQSCSWFSKAPINGALDGGYLWPLSSTVWKGIFRKIADVWHSSYSFGRVKTCMMYHLFHFIPDVFLCRTAAAFSSVIRRRDGPVHGSLSVQSRALVAPAHAQSCHPCNTIHHPSSGIPRLCGDCPLYRKENMPPYITIHRVTGQRLDQECSACRSPSWNLL
jgi:hypothetical protein